MLGFEKGGVLSGWARIEILTWYAVNPKEE